MPTIDGIGRALRRRPAPGFVVLVLALVGAFLVSHSCQRNYVRVTENQAVALGERQLDFDPQGHTIRMVLRGVPPRRYWAISYFINKPGGDGFRKLTILLIDANTGKVQVERESP